MKSIKKRLFAAVLAAALAVSALPGMAFAEEIPDAACTVTEGCTLEEGHEGECVLPAAEPGEGEGEPAPAPCAATEGCTLEEGHEGECVLPAAEPGEGEGEPAPAPCTATEGCTLEEGHEGECVLPAAEPGESESEPAPAPCTATEGCTLEEGHEGECVLPATELGKVARTANANNTFIVGGIRYLITGEGTVSVISTGDIDDDFLPPGAGIGLGTSTYSGEISIPQTVQDGDSTYSVTGINARAFSTTEITKVSIPASVKIIGSGAFYNCTKLTEVLLNEGLEEIGSDAFSGCFTLSVLDIPSTVIKIGTSAFGSCRSLMSLHIPAGVTEGLVKALVGNSFYPYLDKVTVASGSPYEIEDGILYKGTVAQLYMGPEENVVVREGTTGFASQETGDFGMYSGFYGVFSHNTKVKSVTLPSTMTSIPANAFNSAVKLETVTLPDSITAIGNSAFYNTGLTSISLPDSVETIGAQAFEGCINMVSAKLPSGLKTLDTAVFRDTKLKSIVLPEGLTSIGEEAFADCESIELVVIPASVTEIDDWAFVDGLADNATIIFQGTTPPTFGSEIFTEGTDVLNGSKIIVPTGSENAYANTDALSTYMKDNSGNVVQNQDYSLSLPDTASVCPEKSVALSLTSEIPEDAVLEITSSNSAVATVNVTGNVTGVAEGTTTITASITMNGVTLVSDTCTVTVGHTSGTEWKSDATSHWHECTVCAAKNEEAAHTLTWVVDKDATATEAGSKHEECGVCGYKKAAVEIPATGTEHTHQFGAEWKSDANNHWQECACGEKSGTAAHTFGDWTTTKAATATEAGSRERSCTVCGYKVAETIPATGTGTGGGTTTTPSDPPKANPETGVGSSSPQTGDPFNVWLYVGLLCVSTAGLAVLAIMQVKKRRSEK